MRVRPVTVRAGSGVELDGAFSSDANGDGLRFTWEQTLGPPRLGTTASAQAKPLPRQAACATSAADSANSPRRARTASPAAAG